MALFVVFAWLLILTSFVVALCITDMDKQRQIKDLRYWQDRAFDRIAKLEEMRRRMKNAAEDDGQED